MGPATPRMRVVLDTGVVLSTLLFPAGRLAWIAGAWRERRIQPLVSGETTAELVLALAYPKFRLAEEEVRLLLAAYLPWTETVEVLAHRQASLPRCRDEADQKFLDLAFAGNAAVLVASDKKLLELAPKVRFSILTPAALRMRFGPE